MRYARTCSERQIAGDVHRHFSKAELLRRLPARMAADDDAGVVHDDRLPKPEPADRLGHGVDRRVVVARVAFVRRDRRYCTNLDFHGATSLSSLGN
jgi:hypothetical protein